MAFEGLQTLQNMRRTQRSLWRQTNFLLPLAAGMIMLLVTLAVFMVDIPWLTIIPVLGYLLVSMWQRYIQPSSTLLIAAAITFPALLLVMLLALFHPDGQVAITWLAITLFILLLCTTGAFVGMWLQSSQKKL